MNNYLSQATNLANPQVLKLSYLNVVKILFLLLEDWKHRLPFHDFKILSWLVDLNTCVDMNVCMCVKTLVWDLVPMYVCKPGEFPVASSITHSLFIFFNVCACACAHMHVCITGHVWKSEDSLWDLGCELWQQTPLPGEPSHWPWLITFKVVSPPWG